MSDYFSRDKADILGKKWAVSCTPARPYADLARLLFFCYIWGVGKASNCLSGGGVSKPHRSKYILVGDCFVQLPRLWLHPFFFSIASARLWTALSLFL
jgi:hypothetical protein